MLDLDAADQAFRDEVRDFLAAALTDRMLAGKAAATSVFEPRAVTQPWHRALYKRGWAAPNWPVEHGGTGWSPLQRTIFELECAKAGAPGLSPMGIRMCAHVLIRFGTPEQQARFLPPMLAGDEYWCQGYSEPGAGSDLAALQCRAVREGDHYIVNGTKIWTSQAQEADWLFALVRTAVTDRRQQGISFVLMPMDSPGLTVRPIRSISGDHELNQLFFDSVRVPVANRVGAEGEGWEIAKYLLEFERGAGSGPGRLHYLVQRLRRIGKLAGASNDANWRAALAGMMADFEALAMLELRVLSRLQHGESPGDAAQMLKLRRSELELAITGLTLQALGAAGLAAGGVEARTWLNALTAPIKGGTNEIQRDLLARVVIGQ